MSNKKGQGTNTLFSLAKWLITAAIFIIVMMLIYNFLGESAEDLQCTSSAYMEHIGTLQAGDDLVLTKSYQFNCPIKRITLTEEDISREFSITHPEVTSTFPLSNERVKIYLGKIKDGNEPPPREAEEVWRRFWVNNLIAEEMLGCWQRVGMDPRPGRELSLFPQKLGTFDRACVVCSRIKVEEGAALRSPVGDTLNNYLKNAPHPNPTITNAQGNRYSMYEFLIDDAADDYRGAAPDWQYVLDPDDPLAVVYMRINPSKASAVLDWVVEPGVENAPLLDALKLMRLSEVKEECDYLGNYQ